ncbi:MAG: hypothetical protein FWB96_08310 [Defluviitaleaceae bacterium]|nr:hypothetical protein [Defluviitaleaceae bacterium]MCL2224952.1 hypothetical protein [Defluviitaleaceae bacterium]MCL2262487.1 hypothetical protein [Defluviitaleaceae bacterium]
MTITAVIKKVADKKLAAVGFKRVKRPEYGSGMWFYERQANGVKYEMYFQKSNLCKGIRLIFVGKCPAHSVERLFDINSLPPFLSNYFKIHQPGIFVEYADEKELEVIITELTDIAIERVIPHFDTLKEQFMPTIQKDKGTVHPSCP